MHGKRQSPLASVIRPFCLKGERIVFHKWNHSEDFGGAQAGCLSDCWAVWLFRHGCDRSLHGLTSVPGEPFDDLGQQLEKLGRRNVSRIMRSK